MSDMISVAELQRLSDSSKALLSADSDTIQSLRNDIQLVESAGIQAQRRLESAAKMQIDDLQRQLNLANAEELALRTQVQQLHNQLQVSEQELLTLENRVDAQVIGLLTMISLPVLTLLLAVLSLTKCSLDQLFALHSFDLSIIFLHFF